MAQRSNAQAGHSGGKQRGYCDSILGVGSAAHTRALLCLVGQGVVAETRRPPPTLPRQGEFDPAAPLPVHREEYAATAYPTDSLASPKVAHSCV